VPDELRPQNTAVLTAAVDGAGDLYIADTGNGRVRKVSTSGIISTYAGGGGQVLASPNTIQPTFAILNGPNSLVPDPAANLYFGDAVNSAQGVVYKVSTSGTLSIFAGGPSNFGPPGYGDGGLATTVSLSLPTGLALDAAGNLHIAVAVENGVRKVTPGGMISTVAGSNSGSYSGDDGPVNQEGLSFPYGVAVDSSGNLYISDQRDERIRMVAPNGISRRSPATGFKVSAVMEAPPRMRF
jgi:sugar lactone lactonase YvrE